MMIEWERLTHAYGSAEDVPDLLRGIESSDPVVVDDAFHALYGNVWHQGTRFEASRYVVPHLFDLVDRLAGPTRIRAFRLAIDIALGEEPPSDETLPFRPDIEFAQAKGLTAADVGPAYRRMLETEVVDEDPLLDAAAIVWARDAYDAAAQHCERFLVWARDSSHLAARAFAVTPWFPKLDAVECGLELLTDDRPPLLRATALIALGLGQDRKPAPMIHQVLSSSRDPVVSVSAAVALALLSGSETPDLAIEVLLDAARSREALDAAGLPFARSLNGYVAKAIHRIEG